MQPMYLTLGTGRTVQVLPLTLRGQMQVEELEGYESVVHCIHLSLLTPDGHRYDTAEQATEAVELSEALEIVGHVVARAVEGTDVCPLCGSPWPTPSAGASA